MTPPPRSRPRTVIYLAEIDAAARDGAAALERVDSGPQRLVQPLTTDAVDSLGSWAAEADCVVFAETPTTAAGATLLEAVEACGSTPVILFSEATYAPSAARSTDGIDGYVRRGTDDAVAHLADEIEWVCAGERAAAATALPAADSDAESDAVETSDTDDVADTGDATGRPTAELLESLPDVAACEERDRLFERLVATAADAVGTEYGWLSTVHFGELTPRATTDAVAAEDLEPISRNGLLDEALRTGEPIRIDDLAADGCPEAPLEGMESLCCVPVADVGLLLLAAAEPAAFDDRDRDLLAAWGRVGAAVLERVETETNLRTDRDRLRQELDRAEEIRDRIAAERDELAAERDRLVAERDRARALFATVPEPAVHYEIDDGQPIVRRVNDAFTDVFDTGPAAVVDEPLDAATVPPGLEHRQATLTEALRAGQRRQLVSRRETVDGVREFRLALVPLEAAEADGATAHNPEGLIVYSDVTDANRRERELAATEARLESIAESLETDVRTPLNVARGYLELAEETGDAEHFAEVETAQERLRERVAELRAIARRDQMAIETEPVAVTDVARRAWIAVDSGDARLVTREDRVLEADKAQLRELFEYLLRAAVESVGADGDGKGSDDAAAGDAPIVTVGATDDGFAVTGHPAGTDVTPIGREMMPVPGRLTAADGTGFGLGPVERIADAHGWDVGVATDEGATFAFRGIDPVDVSRD
ncbi:putative phytochrome sensor protein [Haloterrigena turkmenica DSM 5511]|uniref:histidine kinase n=1 Tax=Haloterrigena turkmenica (strain ATCC 51198 / DSM 5511 / JCM 9101 / NCIMB 13204 / VKM B-1734 / 4k) TaxID=543526 RepID=D2RSV5_HALTV|nr:GAF domain-containing protein [Haloterrigena turkmenica]ADB58929.1 putative phytochrome sensor protein [Haloterrigena turkmenica DSM 5511]